MAKQTLAILLLCIALVSAHIAVSSPAPKKSGFNDVSFCGMSPTTIGAGTTSPWGVDSNGNALFHTVIAGTSLTFDYALAHNFESLQSGRFLNSSDYSQFLTGNFKTLVDGVTYNSNIQNTLTVILPLDDIPQGSISVYSDELQYGDCVDLLIRCPLGFEGVNCASVNQSAIAYLAGLAKTDPTTYQSVLSTEYSDPNIASLKTQVEANVNSFNNPASSNGTAIGVSIFVIAFVAIIAGVLYWRHKDPTGFSMKVDGAKYWMSSKFSKGGSSSSSLPMTKTTTTPVATTTPVPVQPRPNVNRPTPPANRPTPPANSNRNTPIPPPKQGATRAPLPPSEEVQDANAYKYAPPVKELPSKPNRPTPPPKRTT